MFDAEARTEVTGTSDYEFTELGKVGVFLFVAGAIVGAASGYWLFSILSDQSVGRYSAGASWVGILAIVTVLSGVASIVSVPMMLVGRGLRHYVFVSSKEIRPRG